MLRLNVSLLLTGLLSLMIGVNVYAQETTITTTPTATTITPATTVTPATTTTTPTTVVIEKPGTPTSTVIVTKPAIVTAVPAPKIIEEVKEPANPMNCFFVEAGWYNNVWVARHRVCQYKDSPLGVAWVEGYWSCTKYNLTDAQCMNWDWVSAHWGTTGLVVY